MTLQKGYSMVEIMMVVVIIGGLAAIAVPTYSRYKGHAKVTAGFVEVNALVSVYESLLNDGVEPSLVALGIIKNPTDDCYISIENRATQSLTCLLISPPVEISGGAITLSRNNTYGWLCSTSGMGSSEYSPKGCAVGTR
jgi:type IV pilus assembly protein PilA